MSEEQRASISPDPDQEGLEREIQHVERALDSAETEMALLALERSSLESRERVVAGRHGALEGHLLRLKGLRQEEAARGHA